MHDQQEPHQIDSINEAYLEGDDGSWHGHSSATRPPLVNGLPSASPSNKTDPCRIFHSRLCRMAVKHQKAVFAMDHKWYGMYKV